MTEGLYPPEGTPRGAQFYIHSPDDGWIVRIWEPSSPDPGYQGKPYWMAGVLHHFMATSGFARRCTLGPRIPDPADLMRHGQRVQEMLEANNRLVEENRRLREVLAERTAPTPAGDAETRVFVGGMWPFAMPRPPLVPIRRRDGEPPCGECHLQPGEVCDVCGAQAEPPPAPERST